MPKKKPAKRGRTKRKHRGAYPLKLWARIRAEYEVGKYSSFEALYQNYTEKGAECPSVQAIKMRSAKETWEKGLREPEIREAMHDKYQRLAAAAGLGDTELIEKITAMVNSADMAVRNQGLQRYYDIAGIKAPHKIARTDEDGSAVPDCVFLVPKNGFEPTN